MHKPKNADTHLIRYAKGHYEVGNLWEDLARIISERNALGLKGLSERKQLLAENVFYITYKYININESEFKQFVLDLQPTNWWKYNMGKGIKIFDPDPKGYDYYEMLVKVCLKKLRYMSVFDKNGNVILELDEPNEDILPLKKKEREND